MIAHYRGDMSLLEGFGLIVGGLLAIVTISSCIGFGLALGRRVDREIFGGDE